MWKKNHGLAREILREAHPEISWLEEFKYLRFTPSDVWIIGSDDVNYTTPDFKNGIYSDECELAWTFAEAFTAMGLTVTVYSDLFDYREWVDGIRWIPKHQMLELEELTPQLKPKLILKAEDLPLALNHARFNTAGLMRDPCRCIYFDLMATELKDLLDAWPALKKLQPRATLVYMGTLPPSYWSEGDPLSDRVKRMLKDGSCIMWAGVQSVTDLDQCIGTAGILFRSDRSQLMDLKAHASRCISVSVATLVEEPETVAELMENHHLHKWPGIEDYPDPMAIAKHLWAERGQKASTGPAPEKIISSS